MSILPFNSPILSTRRKGDILDPYIPLVQSILVKENKVLLSEIPSQFEHVTVSGLDVTWTEIYKDLPNEDQFLVDYTMGLVYFHPSRNNSELQFTFKGTGCQYFPIDRIWTQADGTTVTETLDEVVTRAQGIILDVDELNDAVLTAQNLKNELDSDISTGSTLHTNLTNDIPLVSPLVSSLDTAISNSVVAKNNLDGSISTSVSSKSNLDGSIGTANQLKIYLDSDISTGNTLHTNLSGDISTGSSLHTTLSEDIILVSPLVLSLDDSILSANLSKTNLDSSISTSTSSKSSLDESITTGNLLKSTLDSDISTGNDLNTTLLGDISTGNSLNITLLGTISTADTSNTNLISTNSTATTKKSDLDLSISNSVTAKNNIDGSVSTANSTKISLDSSNTVALATKTSLDGSNTTALATKDLLDSSNSTANSTKNSLDLSISTGNTSKTNLDNSIILGDSSKSGLDNSIDSATTINGTLSGTIETANTSISELNAISDAFQLIEAYDPLHPYIPLNKVTYNGSTYQCILASTGNLPTNTTYWILIAMAGTGAVSSVTSANNDISIATTTSTPVLTLNSGITANQILKLDSDAKIPAVDGSLLTGLVKSQVGLSDVDNSADSAKNVLSATKLTTARNINGVAFDGTENITIEDSTKEPTITKNTAFNKNYGVTATDVKMNGTQSVGSIDEVARIDHIHPSDTSKANVSTTVAGYGITDAYTKTEIDGKTGDLSTITTTSKIIAPAIIELKASVDAINASSQTQPLTLTHGLKVITTDRVTPINALAINGVTRINLAGQTGRTETSTTVVNLTSTNYYVVINDLSANVTVDGVSQATPHKFTSKTSTALSWASGYVSVYQVDLATYNKIGVDADYTGLAILKIYPYVDSYQVLQNPMVKVEGKNLAGMGYQWTIGSTTSTFIAPAIVGQAYTLSKIGASTLTMAFLNSAGTVINGELTGTQTAPALTVSIRLTVNKILINDIDAEKIMLNLGSTALAYEFSDPSYKIFPCKLADGETLQEIDGQGVATRKIEDVVLDGSLGWSYIDTGTGYKIVATPNHSTNMLYGVVGNELVKYNGKIMSEKQTIIALDQFLVWNSGLTYISISSADSGLGDAYAPTSDEIKAYFYRWQMNNGTFGTPYNGTGTKTWVALGATSNVGAVTVCPTADSTSAYDHYQLHYTLATPTTEIIIPEGSLMFHEGANQVGLIEGAIDRESVIPYSDGTNVHINGVNSLCYLKKRLAKFYGVYKTTSDKGTVLDPNWKIISYTSNGLFRASITVGNYDASASYSTSYEVLDKHLYTTNAITATGTYDTNDHTVLGHTVEKVSEVETMVSVVERGKANKNQMSWIAPTLLNGWVNLGGVTATSGYYKDEFGLVRLRGYIKSGITTQGTILFTLPLGYRPAATEGFMVYANDGASIGTISISSGGNVAFITGSSLDMSLSGVSFRAEQ